VSATLRKLIRQAELYGVEGVWEAAASDLSIGDLRVLAGTLARVDPKWRPVYRDAAYRDKRAVCGECGEPFPAVRSTARYCSATCRQRAHRRGRAA
jgi:hypothetical protein